MAKKQVNDNIAGATPVRAAQPRASRVKAATHSSKAAAVEQPVPVIEETVIEEVVAVAPEAPQASADPREIIAKIAYGYWEARGRQGGDPLEDWVRAEQEYVRRSGNIAA